MQYSRFEFETHQYFNSLGSTFFEKSLCPYKHNAPAHHLFQKESMEVVRCPECLIVFNRNQAGDSYLEAFYQKSKAMDTWSKLKENQNKKQTAKFQKAVSIIHNHKASSVLDIGCGNGFFLSLLDVAERVGVDSHRKSLEVAKKLGAETKLKGIEEFFTTNKRRFDVITLWGILEHYKEPLGLLNACYEALNHKGLIFICVPNMGSEVVKTLGKECFTFCPQHLWYFTLDQMADLCDHAGFFYNQHYTIEPEIAPIIKARSHFPPYGKTTPKTPARNYLLRKIKKLDRGYKLVYVGEKNETLCDYTGQREFKINQKQKSNPPQKK